MKKNSPANKTIDRILLIVIICLIMACIVDFSAVSLFVPVLIIYIVVKYIIMLGNTSSLPTTPVAPVPTTPVAPVPTTNFVDNFVKCPKCNVSVKAGAKFCGSCGAPIPEKKYVTVADYDPILKFSESILLDEFIARELGKAQIDPNTELLPFEVLKRRKVLSAIFSALLFILVSMIFFHFPILTYGIGILILIVFYNKTKKYNIIKYLSKEIKARPNEKISNIVMNTKNQLTVDNQKTTRTIMNIVAVFLPLIIFMTPHIMYEETTTGYSVRFYTFGLTNMSSATIPSTHNGKDVVSLRRNTFSNMPFLKSVTLPDTIKEIRGQAFKNDFSLVNVNIPKNLEYLGGGAFYNCTSITSITLPDTLTFLGGESFKNASSLETIKLSENITEIRGNSFEECTSLKEITIPDKVTRIGGHAFYGAKSLNKVTLTENSQLNEIGSSAFRQCESLYSITIPKNTYVNEKAFKESPTHIYYFELGTKSKYIYASSEDQATVIETDNFGNVYVQVDSVQYTSYDNWKVQLKLTGGLNESVSFDNYYKEVLVRKNFDIKISSCNSNGKVGIKITYN